MRLDLILLEGNAIDKVVDIALIVGGIVFAASVFLSYFLLKNKISDKPSRIVVACLISIAIAIIAMMLVVPVITIS